MHTKPESTGRRLRNIRAYVCVFYSYTTERMTPCHVERAYLYLYLYLYYIIRHLVVRVRQIRFRAS
jgi:hypothetical protein